MCEYLIGRLQQNAEVVSITLRNKPNLIARCGDATAELFRGGCRRVVIVWDLYPPWRPHGERPCRREDREAIFQSLSTAGVDPTNVHLVCICEELEAWLLADKRAIAAAILKLTGREPRISNFKNPESIRNPKAKLKNIFKQHTHREYQEHSHAIKIIRELPDFNKLRQCQSFARFVLRTTGIEL